MTRPSAVRPDWRDADDVRRALVESSTDAILATDLEGSIAMANGRSAELFGFAAPDEMLGLSLSGLLPDADGESVTAGTARLPVEVHTSTVCDSAGRPTGTLCVIRDVSELERLRGEHQAIFEATGDGMVVYTMDGTIVAANPAFCEMNGYACEELVGRNVSLLVHLDKHDLLRELIQTIASGGPCARGPPTCARTAAPSPWRSTGPSSKTRAGRSSSGSPAT